MKPFEVRATEEWSLSADDVNTLCVTTADSAIRVAGEETDTIHVEAIKTARAASEVAARAFLEEMKVERRREGDRWVVEATWPQPRPHGIESAGISFDIRMPSQVALEAESRNGAIEASAVAQARLRTSNGQISARQIGAGVDARTSNGAVRIDGCGGPVEARTENGRIEVRRAQSEVQATTCNGAVSVEECAGPVEVKTENARVDLHGIPTEIRAQTCNGAIHAEDCPGPIEARTSSGEIAIRHACSALLARTSDGRIGVELERGEGAAQAELVTSNGAIDLRLPEDVSARLVADTSNARITLEQPASGRVNVSSPHLDTIFGTGEGSVRLRTSNGSIRIRLAD
jgi:DUF4097 and DUF4098 domain-containing protein YvlB